MLAGVEVVAVTAAAAAGLGVTTRLNWKRETVVVVGAAVVAVVGAVVGKAVVDVVVLAGVKVVAVTAAAGFGVTTRLNRKRETVVGAAVGAIVGVAVDEAIGAADRGADGGAVAVVEPTPNEDVTGADGTRGAAKTASIPWLAGARPKKILLKSYEWISFL